jgi:hypothetical protein
MTIEFYKYQKELRAFYQKTALGFLSKNSSGLSIKKQLWAFYQKTALGSLLKAALGSILNNFGAVFGDGESIL